MSDDNETQSTPDKETATTSVPERRPATSNDVFKKSWNPSEETSTKQRSDD